MKWFALLLVGCARQLAPDPPLPPLPLPPSDDIDYCAKPPPMRIEEWRVLCGQRPRALATDAGSSDR